MSSESTTKIHIELLADRTEIGSFMFFQCQRNLVATRPCHRCLWSRNGVAHGSQRAQMGTRWSEQLHPAERVHYTVCANPAHATPLQRCSLRPACGACGEPVELLGRTDVPSRRIARSSARSVLGESKSFRTQSQVRGTSRVGGF